MLLLLACASSEQLPLAHTGPDRVGPAGIPFVFESTEARGDITWTLLETPEESQLTQDDLIVDGELAWLVPDVPGLYLVEQEACLDVTCTRAEALATAWGTISGAAPTADAGADQSGTLGDTSQLDASGSSDPEGDTLTYRWRFVSVPAGSSLTFLDIVDRKDVTAEFTGDVAGTYTLRVFVDDGTTEVADTMDVTLTAGNTAPVADAGADLAVTLGDAATFDGSGSSDADGDPLTYRWGFKSLPAASSLSNADWTDRYTTGGSFTPDATGTYEARFVVMDGTDQDVGFADAVVTNASNTAPVSDAGADTSGSVGTAVTLDGSGSYDPDGDAISYRWGWKWVPAGSALTNSDWTDRYTSGGSFTPDVAGTYQARLVVNDGVDETVDIVDIVVGAAANNAPVADTTGSDTTGVVGGSVTLDGTSSYDPDSNPFTYWWVFTQTPAGSSLTNPDISGRATDSASFTPDVAGDYETKLKLDDGTDLGRAWLDVTVYTYGYDDVQAIFDANCTSCHGGSSPSAGMDLSGDAYTTIVNQPSDDVPSMDLVEPGDSANSYLLHKTAGTQSSVGGSGQSMPFGSTLSAADQSVIETWVDEGAPDI